MKPSNSISVPLSLGTVEVVVVVDITIFINVLWFLSLGLEVGLDEGFHVYE